MKMLMIGQILIELIDFINNSSDIEFETELQNHLDLGPFLSSAALDNIFSNLDSYTQSARNYYIYHNLGMGKWQWIKWDANEAFGSYGFFGGANPSTLNIDYHSENRPLLERIFSNANLMNQYTSEVCLLINTVFNPEYLNPIIDDLKALIQDEVYADNNKMFSNNDFDQNIENDLGGGGPGGGPGGPIQGLKSFVQERYDYLTSVVDCEPFSGIHLLTDSDISMYPNPSSLLITIEGIKSFPAQIEITDPNGVLIQSDLIYNSNQSIDISKMKPNLYFLKVDGQVLKLVKN